MSFCIQRNAWFDSGFMLIASDHGGSGVEVATLAVDTGSGICFAGLLVRISLALCVLSGLQTPWCSASWSSLDQKDSYALFPGCGMNKAGIAGTVLLAMCLFPGWQAHDARHHGRYEPEEHVSSYILS